MSYRNPASRITMGQAQRIYGVTARAIRHYETYGLLDSARDHRNQRIFEGDAATRLGWIVALRAVGISIREICDVLAVRDVRDRLVDLALTRLDQRREILVAQLNAIDAHSRSLRDQGRLAELDGGGSQRIACGPIQGFATAPADFPANA